MEELQVLVQQQPGVIKWNYQDLKDALRKEMEIYKKLVYTDDTIPAAKKDVATLRKLRTAVEDKRKEIKNKCLEPYEIIEAQAKELTGLIDEPIKLISDQTDEYERRRREAAKTKIIDYMTETFSELPPDIAKKAQFAIYDSRWENKTAKESEWQSAINAKCDEINTALQVIENTDQDFRDAARKVYEQNLSLPDAMAKVQELQKQREMILEQQRRREEAERARREAEAVRAQKIAEGAAAPAPQENHAAETQNNAFVSRQEPETPREERREETIDNDLPHPTARITLFGASDAQILKIVNYIKFTGVKCEVSRR